MHLVLIIAAIRTFWGGGGDKICRGSTRFFVLKALVPLSHSNAILTCPAACRQVLLKAQEVEPVELDFLLRYPFVTNLQSPVEFLSDTCWGGVVALSNMAEFK